MEEKEEFQNPIDKDKITDQPHLLPYAHTVGGFVIKPLDKGKIKGVAMQAMYEQTDLQMGQIVEQIELLAKQAKQLKDRVKISESIYLADMGFSPLVGHTYHFYENEDGKNFLSMIGPNEWGKKQHTFTFVATVKLLGDHTWDILQKNE